jgi:hypothetical protein
MSTRQALPVLRCFAGDLPIGLPAEEVVAFRAAEPGSPHIAALLGLAGCAPREAGPAHAPSPGATEEPVRWTLELAAGALKASVNVDGPVRIRSMGTSDLLATPALLTRTSIAPLLGFAEEEGRVVLLLDVPSVARLVEAGALKGKDSCSS